MDYVALGTLRMVKILSALVCSLVNMTQFNNM